MDDFSYTEMPKVNKWFTEMIGKQFSIKIIEKAMQLFRIQITQSVKEFTSLRRPTFDRLSTTWG